MTDEADETFIRRLQFLANSLRRRDEPAVAVPPGNVKEKVPKGVDLELGQAAGHLGPHAAHVADRIAKGQHRRGC